MITKFLPLCFMGIIFTACIAPVQAITNSDNGGGTGTGGGSGGSSGSGTGPQTWAILVGSHAPSAGYADALRGDQDVDRVAAKLSSWANVQSFKYDWNLPSPADSQIQGAIGYVAQYAKPGDSLIFYYSGHGTGGSGLGVEDFINPVSSVSYQDYSLAAGLSDSRLANLKKFVLIDACHSEGLWNNDFEGDADLQSLHNISFLASATEDGVSYSDPVTGAGYFTSAILSGIGPNATFNSLLTLAQSASTNEVTGYFKDDGSGTGYWHPVGHVSGDFSADTQLNGLPVPEPAAIVLLLAAAPLFWRRHR
jgi:hypothetical protein